MRQLRLLASAILLGLLVGQPCFSEDFYPIDGVEVELPQGGSLWPVSNLIQGPGLGFDADEPHDINLTGNAGLWVTDACGFPCDYVDVWGEPVISFDLGENRLLDEISYWGYSDTNSNGTAEFNLRFATDAEGPDGFGSSIAFNPTYETLDDPNLAEVFAFERQSFEFSESVTARFVQMTVTDNFFIEPGDGSAGEIPGGDRVGIGEVAFRVPEGVIIDPPPPPPDPIAFYPIDDITSTSEDEVGDFYPVQNLIQGPGEGFNEDQPHQKILDGAEGNWVTEACGFPCDYLESFDEPILVVDLGEDQELTQIDIWGYASSNANGASAIELRFATEADGEGGFGSTITYNPGFDTLSNENTNARQEFPFDQAVSARYVEIKITDNFFEEPGDGSNGETPGGDRIGLGEIAFPILPLSMLPGDFDGDGVIDVDDINLLGWEVAAGTNAPEFDLNDDNEVNLVDMQVWVGDIANTWMGDANLDGQFNSTDFVRVFTAGKFELDVEANWEEGDWNGDHRFNSRDFIVAFQDGGFEMGPKPEAAAVPEPSTAVLLLISAVTLGLCHRRASRFVATS